MLSSWNIVVISVFLKKNLRKKINETFKIIKKTKKERKQIFKINFINIFLLKTFRLLLIFSQMVGYDKLRFLRKDLPKDLFCAVCLQVLKEPINCKNCEMFFCLSCSEKA